MTGIAHPLDTTLKISEFFGRLTPGTQQMSNTQDQPYKAKSEQKLDTYRKITNGIIQIRLGKGIGLK